MGSRMDIRDHLAKNGARCGAPVIGVGMRAYEAEFVVQKKRATA